MNREQIKAVENLHLTVRPVWAKTTAHWILVSVDGDKAVLTTRRGKKILSNIKDLNLTSNSLDLIKKFHPDISNLFE